MKELLAPGETSAPFQCASGFTPSCMRFIGNSFGFISNNF